MSYEEFEALTSGIESIFLSIAVIAGAIWSVFLYKVLKEKEHRRKQIEQSELEMRKTEAEIRQIELTNKQQAAIQISIEASQQSLPNDPSSYVSAVVEIVNKGNRNTRLPTSREPFTVRAVNMRGDEKQDFIDEKQYMVRRASDPRYPTPNIIVRAGAREKIPFFFRANGPGLYLLTFHVELTHEEQEVAEKEGFAAVGSWTGKKYFIVE